MKLYLEWLEEAGSGNASPDIYSVTVNDCHEAHVIVNIDSAHARCVARELATLGFRVTYLWGDRPVDFTRRHDAESPMTLREIWKENPHLHHYPFGLTTRGGLRGMVRRFLQLFRDSGWQV